MPPMDWRTDTCPNCNQWSTTQSLPAQPGMYRCNPCDFIFPARKVEAPKRIIGSLEPELFEGLRDKPVPVMPEALADLIVTLFEPETLIALMRVKMRYIESLPLGPVAVLALSDVRFCTECSGIEEPTCRHCFGSEPVPTGSVFVCICPAAVYDK